MKKTPLIVVCGPTASGKTSLAINIAQKLKTEIISADSIQIYKDIETISAAPTKEEQALVTHHLVGFKNLQEEYSVSDFVSDAEKIIEKIANEGKLPVICGGTGLYISSLINGIEFPENSENSEVRERLNNTPADELYKTLSEKDPESAEWIHPNNVVRVIRALEIMETTGLTFSEYRKKAAENESPYDVLVFFLNTRNRELLYNRIERRVDKMITQGMESEAKAALRENPSKTALAAIGLKEFSIDNTLDDIIGNIKKGTRHYAKRQITWFSHIKDAICVYLEDFSNQEQLTDFCITKIKERFCCEE